MVSALVGSRLRLDWQAVRDLCERYRIVRLSLYGSVLRTDFRPDSDVDVLVEFEPGHRVGLFALSQIALELGDLLQREVDVKTLGDFPPSLRDEIQRTAEDLYAAA